MAITHLFQDNRPLLLDGGLSNVLEARGWDLNHKLWTAHLLDQHPEAIIRAHLDYLEAGAQCITTASYQASLPGLIAAGYSKESAIRLLEISTELAEAAVEKFMDTHAPEKRPLIAASVGPYGAYLADGSEYRGNYGVSAEVLFSFHRERIEVLAGTGADVLAVETIPSLPEAKVLATILLQVDKPAWISFSCRDEEHLNDGATIAEAVSIFRDHPSVFAVGVNCTKPAYISGIIRSIRHAGIEKHIVVYPNSGEAYNANTKTWLGLSEPLSFARMYREWHAQGADIIGGCCRIGPEQIKSVESLNHPTAS
jgi:homocysteine S-methyltransferase